jgi:hypothetical protein
MVVCAMSRPCVTRSLNNREGEFDRTAAPRVGGSIASVLATSLTGLLDLEFKISQNKEFTSLEVVHILSEAVDCFTKTR